MKKYEIKVAKDLVNLEYITMDDKEHVETEYHCEFKIVSE